MELFKLLGTIAINGIEETRSGLDKILETASSVANKIGGKFEKIGESVTDIGTKMTVGLSAPLTLLGKSAVSTATDFENAINSFAAQTGIAKEEMTEYEDVLKSIYANNYGESFEDIAKAMSTIKQQSGEWLQGAELETLTTQALILRDTFEYDVSESIRAASMLMDQFNLSGEVAYDAIAQGAQKGLDKNGDLLDVINEYSVHFSQLGFEAEDMFNMLLNGAKEGTFSVDKLGDAVKEFGIRVKDGSDSSREAFEYLGYDADKLFSTFNEGGEDAAIMTNIIIDELTGMADGVEKTTAGVALFGTMWEDLGVNGIKALGELNGEIDITKDTLSEINEIKYDSISSALEGLKRTFETSVLAPLGEALIPVVERAIVKIQEIGEKVAEWVEWFSGLDSKTQDLIIRIGAFLIAAGPLLIFIGKVVSSIGSIINIGASLIGGIGKVSGALSTIMGVGGKLLTGIVSIGGKITSMFIPALTAIGPVGWAIIAAIGALIAIGVALYKNWDEVCSWASKTWTAIKETIGGAIDSISGFFTGLIDGARELKENISEKFNELKDSVTSKIEELKENAVAKFNEFKKNTVAKVEELKENAVQKFSELKEKAIDKFNELKEKAEVKIEELRTSAVEKFNELKEKATTKVEELKEQAVTKFNDLKDRATEKIVALKDKSAEVIENLKQNALDGFENLKSGALERFENLKSGISEKLEGVKSFVSDAVQRLRDFFDFDWELPKIKLPHFNISGEFSLNPPSIPSFGVEWYKDGGIMHDPTIFGFNPMTNKAMVGGEDGAEAIAPIDTLQSYIRDALSESNSQLYSVLNAILSVLSQHLPELANMQIVMNTGEMVGVLAPAMDEELGRIAYMRGRTNG